jgi:hypothetical protein
MDLSWKSRRAFGAVLSIFIALVVVGPTAMAVHDVDLFELDGDATASGAVPGAYAGGDLIG